MEPPDSPEALPPDAPGAHAREPVHEPPHDVPREPSRDVLREPLREPLREAVDHDDEWERAAAPRRLARPWIGAGLRIAALVAAATAGVLVQFGHAAGLGRLGAFTHVGRLATGVTAADAAPAQWLATGAGVLLHLLVTAVWSLLFAALAEGRRRSLQWAMAAGVALLAWGAGHTALPGMLRLGHGARAFPVQSALLHVVLAVTLAVGMRLALPERHER